MRQGACRELDPELFFPQKNDADSSNKAIMACFSCPVRTECNDYRERTGTKHGVWGGKHIKRDD